MTFDKVAARARSVLGTDAARSEARDGGAIHGPGQGLGAGLLDRRRERAARPYCTPSPASRGRGRVAAVPAESCGRTSPRPGSTPGRATAPRRADRRFRDPKWDDDPTSRGLRDAHLAIETRRRTGCSPPCRRARRSSCACEFYTRQFLSALAPQQLPDAEPRRARPLRRDRGREPARRVREPARRPGARRRAARHLRPTTARPSWSGATSPPRPARWSGRTPLMQLIQYEPTHRDPARRPLLFVPAWINKYYILDMRPKNSLVRYMLDRGHTRVRDLLGEPGPASTRQHELRGLHEARAAGRARRDRDGDRREGGSTSSASASAASW